MGTSTRPLDSAKRRMTPVSKTEAANTRAPDTMIFSSTVLRRSLTGGLPQDSQSSDWTARVAWFVTLNHDFTPHRDVHGCPGGTPATDCSSMIRQRPSTHRRFIGVEVNCNVARSSRNKARRRTRRYAAARWMSPRRRHNRSALGPNPFPNGVAGMHLEFARHQLTGLTGSPSGRLRDTTLCHRNVQ